MFMGLMLEKTSGAERMMHSMQRWFGNGKGGIAIRVTLIVIILVASTGIIGGSVVLLGIMSLPVMLKQNYDKPIALGTVAASGTLGILIPPSIMLVIMGDQLAVSVVDLFMGAVFPGLILGILYVVYIYVYGLFNTEHVPLAQHHEPIGLRDVLRVMVDILPPASLFFAILRSHIMVLTTVTTATGMRAI